MARQAMAPLAIATTVRIADTETATAAGGVVVGTTIREDTGIIIISVRDLTKARAKEDDNQLLSDANNTIANILETDERTPRPDSQEAALPHLALQ